MAMLMGSAPLMDGSESPEQEHSPEVEEGARKLREAAEKIVAEVADTAVVGAKIVDKKDGKTVGQIISPPAPGTTVVLAQMRLDRVGITAGDERWDKKNQVIIGEGEKEVRYLPYLPLWWPDIDPNTGKKKEKE